MHDVQYLCGFSKNPMIDLLLGGVVDGTPDSGMPIEAKKIAFWRDFGGTPIHTTWVPLKSIVERFRCLLRDFCFWAIFLVFRIEKLAHRWTQKNLDLRRLRAYQRKKADGLDIPSASMVIQNGSGMTKITA